MAVVTDSSRATQGTHTVLGLPPSTAVACAALFAAAFCFYIAIWSAAPVTAPDSLGYLNVAHDLADFHVDQLNLRPPGYPFLLALAGTGRPLFYTSLVLHFASAWMITAALFAMGLGRGWLLSAALLLSLPPYVEYAAYVLSDNLSEFLLTLSFSSLLFWFVRGGRTSLVVCSAIAIACNGLTRPTYQLLAVVFSGFLLASRLVIGANAFERRSWIKASAILLIVSGVSLGAFSVLNYVKFDFFGIYPMAGFNLLNRTSKVLERLPDQYAAERELLIKARDAALIERGGSHEGYDYFWTIVPELTKVTGTRTVPELSQHLAHLGLLLIAKAPLYYLREFISSFSGHWLPTATEFANANSRALQALWFAIDLAVIGAFFLQLFVVGGFAMFQLSRLWFVGESWLAGEACAAPDRSRLFAYAFAGTIIFYNAVTSAVGGNADPRYRLPAEPLIVFMCLLGFHLWIALLRAPRLAERAGAVLEG